SQVDTWFHKLWPYLGDAEATPAKPLDERVSAQDDGRKVEDRNGLPETFGEFLHSVRDEVSDTDRMLIAGFYIQEKSPDRSFSTGAANDLLKEQGIKLGNASECSRRNLVAKRLFAISKGNFRISKDGFQRIQELQK